MGTLFALLLCGGVGWLLLRALPQRHKDGARDAMVAANVFLFGQRAQRSGDMRSFGALLMVSSVVPFFGGIVVLQSLQEPTTAARAVPLQPARSVAPEPALVVLPSPPALDVARQEIPGTLKTIYATLNDGNVSTLRGSVSEEILRSQETLDVLCKPFSYRAHYVEGIVENANGTFAARLRTLFKPVDEHVQTLTFSRSTSSFVLTAVADSRRTEYPKQLDWSGNLHMPLDRDELLERERQPAEETARKFLYAVFADNQEVARNLVSNGFDLSRLWAYSDLLSHCKGLREFGSAVGCYHGTKVFVSAVAETTSYHYRVNVRMLLEPLEGRLRIVFTDWYLNSGHLRIEDPDLDHYTLQRFGLTHATPLPPSGPARLQE